MTENQKEILVIILAFLFVFLGLMWITRVRAEAVVDLEIIKQIESSGDPHAYNKRSGATGLYQITKICLEDFNIFGVDRISCENSMSFPTTLSEMNYYNNNCWLEMDELYNPANNYRVANWYMNIRIPQLLKHFGHEDNIENRLIAYNMGIGKLNKWIKNGGKYCDLPRETRNYLKKYKRRSK